MAVAQVRVSDLALGPARVARALLSWERGEPAEAVRETLAASARELHRRGYTVWAWIGACDDGSPGIALPVRSADAVAFAPRGPAQALARCLAAIVEIGADPALLRLRDWHGLVVAGAPGAELGLLADALAEAHPAGTRVAVAELPPGVVLHGPPLALRALGYEARADPLGRLARATGVHPLRVALTLAEHGQSVDDPPLELARSLREWGCDGAPAQPGPPAAPVSLALEDDPCPRRRHARKVLRRLLRMGKVGSGYHTEIDHLYRGAAADERADALRVGEALVRAGLLGEKPSVGQRHVYLRREALPQIHALIERGESDSPVLAALWTAPAPTAEVDEARPSTGSPTPP